MRILTRKIIRNSLPVVMIRLIVFLGNPGKQYEYTRHNAGWMVLSHVPFDRTPVFQNKFNGEFGQASLAGRQVYLLKPATLMNNSGKSTAACMNFYKIPPEEVLVVHDDLELAFGDIRPKTGGGMGGHNGLKSIMDALGTGDFPRLYIGIGRPEAGTGVVDHVLSPPAESEQPRYDRAIADASEALAMLESTPIERVMNEVNRRL